MRSARNFHSKARYAFTLLELMIAIFIAILLMLAAAPSINGLLQERRAKRLFNAFNDLAREAGSRAVAERRPYVLDWGENGVTMHPLGDKPIATPGEATGSSDSGDSGEKQYVDFGEKMAPDLFLPASLVKIAPRRWTFWPTGTCEPAKITCHVPDAPWTATYDALTELPVFTSP